MIGANGAGKTTLLRVMAGIYEPTGGTIEVEGRISPMFDINLGIDSDLSGYDNIRIRGLLLGISTKEIEERLPEIAEFTELEEYLDMPVRVYSSGMMLRLTFAVATCFEPEILLMDEWIQAGDARFINKAKARIDSFVDKASVLVLASLQPRSLPPMVQQRRLDGSGKRQGIWRDRQRYSAVRAASACVMMAIVE